MDPMTLIVTALAAGASSGALEGLTGTAKDAVEAAYARLRDLLRQRFRGSASGELILAEYQADPATYAAPLVKKLATAGACDDADVVAAAKALMDLLDQAGVRAGGHDVKIDNSEGIYIGDGGIQINRFGT